MHACSWLHIITLIINATTLKAAPPVIPRALVFFELELELELELFKYNRYNLNLNLNLNNLDL
jgi:hypothetical protein